MATPVIMPKFGMAQEDGTILRWLKHEGDRVEKGEVLLEVLTDKVDMEVEAPAAGILRDVRFGVDATVPVATVIAEIADSAEEARIATSAPPERPEARTEARTRISPVAQRLAREHGIDLEGMTGSGAQGRILRADVARATAPAGEGRLRATPAARRLARAEDIPLAAMAGSGPEGRIQAADVVAAIQAPPADSTAARPINESGLALRGLRRTIATRLTTSWQSIPHIFLTTRVDMSRGEEMRTTLRGNIERRGGRLTPTVLVAHAVASALKRHPHLNATLQMQGDDLLLTEHTDVHLGIAVALSDGLIVPVIRNADTLGLATLATQISDLGSRARDGRLTPDEATGGTFTLSSLGAYPVDHFTAIINPPQVAILAVGRIRTEPVWDGATFQAHPVVELTLSADHRAIDGAIAASFLTEVKDLLEEPVRLLLE